MSRVLRYLNYLYFMRFSILLWLMMPALALLDMTVSASMTRGIVALDSFWHLFLAAFFVTLNGWIAMLSARIVCAYGRRRFLTPVPRLFLVTSDMSFVAFFLAQVPGFFLLSYVAYISRQEEFLGGYQYSIIVPALVCGFLGALFCWILLAGIYSWLFWNKDPRGKEAPTMDPFKAFLMPCHGPFRKLGEFFVWLQEREPSALLLVLIEIGKPLSKLGPGYKNKGRKANPLHSGHALALLVLGFMLIFYLVFWDFTSPVTVEMVHTTVVTAIPVILGIWVLSAGVYYYLVLRRRTKEGDSWIGNMFLMIGLLSPVLAVCSLPYLPNNWRHEEAMPVLGSVSVLLLFVTWGLSAMAFFFDRYRVPVALFFAVIFILGNLATGTATWILPLPSDHTVQLAPETYHQNMLQDKNQGDKLRSTNKDKDEAKRYVNHLPTPAGIYKAFAARNLPKKSGVRPVIIITATGGGIHAAAWTSAVLEKLEQKFRGSGTDFHDSILLMSTVSGGTVGTVPWAAEYLKTGTRFTDTSLDGMKDAARCSELQAVSWGLTYADFLRLVYPWRHFLWSRDLDTYDRGWALQQAFWRNRKGPCGSGESLAGQNEETLGDLAWNAKDLPAFSFNTTVAETGNRFLSANYVVPKHVLADNQEHWSEIVTADSFLDIYHQDLPLSSAARLSATFPYVSPMPRVPVKDSRFHFGDGGYFDNDGTATALEFLWYALNDPNEAGDSKAACDPKTDNNACVPVLLLEIRDEGDVDAAYHPEELPNQKDYPEWGAVGQLVGPLETFWNAGHVAVTKRNRRELCFMERALEKKVRFAHIVLAYEGDPKEVHALSWHLTTKQQKAIDAAVNKPQVQVETNAAVAWYRGDKWENLPRETQDLLKLASQKPIFGCSHIYDREETGAKPEAQR
jgi:hypothetical protein